MSFLSKTGLDLANVKDYGAKGDGTTDDTAAIQAAIDDAIANSLGGIFLPPGTYVLGPPAEPALSVSGVTNFQIRGAGPESVLLYEPVDFGGADSRMLLVTGGSSGVLVADLTFDGNRADVSNIGAGPLVEVVGTIGAAFVRCVFARSSGWAASIGDGGTTVVEKISFEQCLCTDNVFGSLVVDGTDQLRVVDNVFELSGPGSDGGFADVDIDGNAGGSSGYIIEGNRMSRTTTDPSIRLQGHGPGVDLLRNAVIVGNFCQGGILAVNTGDLLIANNDCLKSSLPIDITVGEDVVVQGNRVEPQAVTGEGIRILTSIVGLVCADNVIRLPSTSGGPGIRVGGITQGKIAGNIITGGAGGIGSLGMRAGGPLEGVQIEGNHVDTPAVASIELRTGALAGQDVGAVAVRGNYLTTAIRFAIGAAGVFTAKPIVSENYGPADPQIVVADLAILPEPAVIIGGIGNDGGTGNADTATQYAGDDTPEGNVSGNLGDLFVDMTNGIVYIKASGVGTNTGWSAIATLAVNNLFTKAQAVKPFTLTYGANIAVDATQSNVFDVTLTGVTGQLDNPTGLVDGQTIIVRVTQDGTGGRALTFDTNWDFGTDGAPDLTTEAAGALSLISGVSDGTKVFVSAKLGYVA